jgi:hypothetical protein
MLAVERFMLSLLGVPGRSKRGRRRHEGALYGPSRDAVSQEIERNGPLFSSLSGILRKE